MRIVAYTVVQMQSSVLVAGWQIVFLIPHCVVFKTFDRALSHTDNSQSRFKVKNQDVVLLEELR